MLSLFSKSQIHKHCDSTHYLLLPPRFYTFTDIYTLLPSWIVKSGLVGVLQLPELEIRLEEPFHKNPDFPLQMASNNTELVCSTEPL